MSDEEDNDKLAHERLADAQEKIARMLTKAGAVQDPLVFVVRGSEIQSLLLDRATRQEKQAAELDALPAPEPLPMASRFVDGPEPSYPMPMPASFQSSEAIRQGARSLRFLAAHVEDDRVFRLALHDMLFLLGSSP